MAIYTRNLNHPRGLRNNVVARPKSTSPQLTPPPSSSSAESYLQWADATDSLLQELRRQNLSGQTLQLYRRALDAFGENLKHHTIDDVRRVTSDIIEQHQHALTKHGYSPRTVAQNIQAIRKLFRHLVTTGKLLLDPSAQVTALKHSRPLPRRIVSESEMRRLLAAPNLSLRTGIRDRAMLELFYGTAMRLGELLAVEVSDIDIDTQLVRIRRGKGRKERVVPMGHTAQRFVSEYLTRVRPWWMKGRGHERRAFVTHSGRPFGPGNVHAMLCKYCKEAKLQRISPHAIRHACATHMLRSGADIRAVQKLLGHADIRTTQRYTRVAITDVQSTHAKTHPLEE